MPALAIVVRHHGPSVSSFLRTWTTKAGGFVPNSSIRGSKRLFSDDIPQYREDRPRSDSYIELRHGIKVQHEFVVSEEHSSIAALPQVPDSFGAGTRWAGIGKKG